MGQRGADREPATEADRADMARLAGEAVRAGALGFSTSRTINHRTSDGKHTPTLTAGEDEILSIPLALKGDGCGVLQLIRSEERRVGTEVVRSCRTRGSPDH